MAHAPKGARSHRRGRDVPISVRRAWPSAFRCRYPWPMEPDDSTTVSPSVGPVPGKSRGQLMNSSSDPQAAFNELWRFSLNFYDRPGIAAALIELQDSAGLDVNLILFALWLGLSGRGRLDKLRLIAAEQAVAAIRANVVMPLRGLRRRLKSIDDADIQRLREKSAALEIDAEKAAQDRLVVLAG